MSASFSWPVAASHTLIVWSALAETIVLRRAIHADPEIGLHCLRHSYVTHLIEGGFDPLFVQQQVGHSHASTTALYTSVSSDFRTRTLRRALDEQVARALGGDGQPAARSGLPAGSGGTA